MHRAFLIHGLSPLHAGTGQAIDLIDLPIARYKATGIPFLPGSSVKGVVRDARTPPAQRPQGTPEQIRQALDADPAWSTFLAAFGPDVKEDDASEHAGAVSFGDARLLLLPVRSLRGTFAYVTSPLLLRFAVQDFDVAQLAGVPAIPDVAPSAATGPDRRVPHAVVPDEATSVLLHRASAQGPARIFLEDHDFIATATAEASAWATWLAQKLLPTRPADLTRRLVIIDDDAMTFLWETATQVDAHNRINDRGTVADGQLWYQENLPPETVLVGLASATVSRRRTNGQHDAANMLLAALPREELLQFGGKATTGKGRARLLPLA